MAKSCCAAYIPTMPAFEKSVIDIFEEGASARALGKPVDANPYPAGSDNHDIWFDGWGLADETKDDTAPNDGIPLDAGR
jgi:hypothetical protein